ncbi:MepB family protein [Myroides pelagicus]|uniref:MepB family protein n=1 Tax=Myroides pelagicus TaxID=270914 RepID=A0A7K1GLC4_9FLAO|nr:MepB family protein [Myroides pelagicus]MEC4112583.1 MepB family protein [Myroides pelagicus]MTH29540.1 hypothetical protein [Myroides pelagicus]
MQIYLNHLQANVSISNPMTPLTELSPIHEKNEYNAHTFKIGEKKVIYRQAKITPKKIGLFVAIWKRNKQGITQPYQTDDAFDFMMISVQTDKCNGYFLFPKEVLGSLGIISTNNKEGKRGMRVYPTLETDMNKQALKTYHSQISFFHVVK